MEQNRRMAADRKKDKQDKARCCAERGRGGQRGAEGPEEGPEKETAVAKWADWEFWAGSGGAVQGRGRCFRGERGDRISDPGRKDRRGEKGDRRRPRTKEDNAAKRGRAGAMVVWCGEVMSGGVSQFAADNR